MSKRTDELIEQYHTIKKQADALQEQIDELDDDIYSVEARVRDLAEQAVPDSSELQRAKDKARHLRADLTRKRGAHRSLQTELVVLLMRIKIEVAEVHGVDFSAPNYWWS